MRLAYVASRYPHLSHTFIRREVESLRALGTEVATFSIRPSETSESASEADRRAAASTTTILPLSASRALRAHVRALVASPSAYARTLGRTLRTSPGGLRATVWRHFYFIEGIVLWWHCERLGISHVHAHFANVGADVARVAARFGGAARPGDPWSWSFTMHGPTEFYDVPGHELGGKAADADAVICISDYCRSQMMRVTDPSHWDRFHVVHCGVDPLEFQASPDGGDHSVLSVVSVGRLVPDKGFSVLIDAVELARQAGVPATLTIVGDGPQRAALEDDVARRGLADVVRFVGAVPSDVVGEHLRSADVFCLASFAEGVPVVLMEAMSCTIPVISTQIAGISELVEDGVSGFVVAPGRPDLVAERLGRLTAPEVRRRFGEAGRRRVEGAFDITQIGRSLRDVFAPLPGIAGRPTHVRRPV